MINPESILKDFKQRRWKPMYQHEPVGCVVLLMLSNGEIRYGYRMEPTTKKYVPNTYISEETGSPFEHDVIYWDYI